MNVYVPIIARVEKIKDETRDTKSFTISMPEKFNYLPGQFVMLSCFGAGEAPFSVSSEPDGGNKFVTTVRKVGDVTAKFHEMKEGSAVGIRGPFGTSWPIEKAKGKELTIIAGGIGLAALRSVIRTAIKNPSLCKHLTILYGARSPQDLVFREELEEWKSVPNVSVNVTVDNGDETWKGNVGLITTLFDKVKIDPKNNAVMMCGPSIMMFFVMKSLKNLGFKDEDVFVSLERHMRCGIGKCGHCNVGPYYVCRHGPVFQYSKVKDQPDVFK